MSRRVLHYIDSEAYGGTEEAALHLMASLDRARWEPTLVYHPGPGIVRLAQRAEQLGISALAIPRVERGARLAAGDRAFFKGREA